MAEPESPDPLQVAAYAPDPGLAARLRDLADARIRAEVALAAQLREAATELRAQQARRRRYGVGLRNAAREARIRLTEHHNQKETP